MITKETIKRHIIDAQNGDWEPLHKLACDINDAGNTDLAMRLWTIATRAMLWGGYKKAA